MDNEDAMLLLDEIDHLIMELKAISEAHRLNHERGLYITGNKDRMLEELIAKMAAYRSTIEKDGKV